jgi:hypothetical protein
MEHFKQMTLSVGFGVVEKETCFNLNGSVPGSAFRVEKWETISCSGFQATITSEPWSPLAPPKAGKP